jgi:hypothetical protein
MLITVENEKFKTADKSHEVGKEGSCWPKVAQKDDLCHRMKLNSQLLQVRRPFGSLKSKANKQYILHSCRPWSSVNPALEEVESP